MGAVGRCGYLLWVICITALMASCATPQPFITIKKEPKNYAWWLRADIRPFGLAVRGIPVSELRPSWCKANEFTLDLFPAEVRFGDDGLDGELKVAKAAFSVARDFGGGRTVHFLLGVYEECAGNKGNFLMAFDPVKRYVLQIVEFREGATFAVMHVANDGRLWVWWCLSCDHSTGFRWNDADKRLDGLPEDEEDIGSK